MHTVVGMPVYAQSAAFLTAKNAFAASICSPKLKKGHTNPPTQTKQRCTERRRTYQEPRRTHQTRRRTHQEPRRTHQIVIRLAQYHAVLQSKASETIARMCGIAGVAFATGSSNAEQTVRAMLPSLARRGPDAEGLHLWPGIGFGHRRLAILDLSPAGAQPMLSADGTVGVVFNGCIYNFVEIRRELEQRGHIFRSQCDTEALIEGYRE